MKDKNERLDDLQNGYMLFQNPKQFCFLPGLQKPSRVRGYLIWGRAQESSLF